MASRIEQPSELAGDPRAILEAAGFQVVPKGKMLSMTAELNGSSVGLERRDDGSWRIVVDLPARGNDATVGAVRAAVVAEGIACVALADPMTLPVPRLRHVLGRLFRAEGGEILYPGRGSEPILLVRQHDRTSVTAVCWAAGSVQAIDHAAVEALMETVPAMVRHHRLSDGRPDSLCILLREAEPEPAGLGWPTEFWTSATLRARLGRHDTIIADLMAPALERWYAQRKCLEEMRADVENRALQLRRMEQELRDSRRKVQRDEREGVLARISDVVRHKVNNPLREVQLGLGNIKKIHDLRQQGLADVDDDCLERRQYDRMEDALWRIGDIMNQLGNASAALGITPEPTTVSDLVALVRAVGSDTVAVSCHLDARDMDRLLHLDLKRLREVLEELLGNSVFHCHPARSLERRLEIALTSGSGDNQANAETEPGQVEIVCNDNGLGVPDDSKEAIFDYRFTTRMGGSGLGLYICRMFVEGHQGSIVEDGTPNQGARFRMHFPLTKAEINP